MTVGRLNKNSNLLPSGPNNEMKDAKNSGELEGKESKKNKKTKTGVINVGGWPLRAVF